MLGGAHAYVFIGISEVRGILQCPFSGKANLFETDFHIAQVGLEFAMVMVTRELLIFLPLLPKF